MAAQPARSPKAAAPVEVTCSNTQMQEFVTGGAPVGAMGEQQLLQLQRAAGNGAVSALLARETATSGKPKKGPGRSPKNKGPQQPPRRKKRDAARTTGVESDALGDMHQAAERIEDKRAAPGAGAQAKMPRPKPAARPKSKPKPRTRPRLKRPPRQKPRAGARSARGPPARRAGGSKAGAASGGRSAAAAAERPAPESNEQVEVDPSVVASLNPRLAAAAQDILAGAAAEKAEMKATAAQQRQTVLAHAAGEAKAVLGEAKAKAQATGAALDGKKAATAAGFDAKVGQITAHVGQKQAAARQRGAASLAAIDAKTGEQKAALLAKANERAAALVQDGEKEATRVLESGKAAAAKVTASKQARIAQYQGDKDAASDVRKAVTEAAGPVISSLQSNSAKGAATARESAAKKAAAIRQEAVKTAAGLGSDTGDVKKAVGDATDKTVAAISAIGTSRASGVRSMKDRALASLADMKQKVTSEIRAAGEQSASTARRGGETAAKAITSSETSALPGVDRAASQAVSSLAGVGGRRKAGPAKVANFTGAVRGKFGEAKQLFAGAVGQQSEKAASGLTAAVGGTTPQLASMGAVAVSAAGGAQTQALTGATAALADVAQNTTQAVSEGDTAGQKAVGQVSSSLDAAVAKADQEWAKEGDKTRSDIHAEAEKAANGNNDVAIKTDTDLGKVAADVAANSRQSLLGQIVSGIWDGIKGFVIGIGKLLLVAGLVFLVLAGLGIIAFSWAAFLAVLAVVGILFLVVALVEAIDQRAKEIASVLPDDAPWWVIGLAATAVVGVAIGDVIGISPIIEGIWGQNIMTGEKLTPQQRSERITAGILQILTLFLFHEVAKRVSGPKGEVDPNKPKGEKPFVEVIDPYTALGRKYGLRPDVVEMLRASKIDPKLFDRILARGVDPDVVALMADGHGLRGVRILDTLSASGVPTADIVKLVEGAESLGQMKELAEATDKGLVGKLFKRGFEPDEINLLLDQLGSTGLSTIDGLMQMGVEKRIATQAAQIAKRIGAEAEVNKLAREGNLRNARGFKKFLDSVETEVEQGKHGLLNELKEAARRSQPPRGTGEDGVALGRSGEHAADVIDFGRKEALQMKTVTGDASALANRVNDAATQFRGEAEKPPPGFTKIVKIIIEGGETANLGRAELLQTMKDNGVTQASLKDVNRVEVRNNRGSFIFSPGEF